ncbi:hypothetical protein V6N13_078863 [Hibiscus sabdariffa]|uniref:Peptidase S8/S53 domain-containing protein n=1 Tax=Hibiscus sabdariffa TaxID=183260 RepID=A0ABR2RPP7_9ROSI
MACTITIRQLRNATPTHTRFKGLDGIAKDGPGSGISFVTRQLIQTSEIDWLNIILVISAGNTDTNIAYAGGCPTEKEPEIEHDTSGQTSR